MEERKQTVKKCWTLAAFPLESNILGFTHKHVTFESRWLQGAQFHHLKCHRLVLSHKPWCHCALDLVADRDGWEGEEGALGGISEWKMQQSDQKAKWQPKISGSKHKNSIYTFYTGTNDRVSRRLRLKGFQLMMYWSHTEDKPNQIQMFFIVSLRFCCICILHFVC